MIFQSLRTVFLVGIAIAGLGILVTFLEKEDKLRTKLNTEFGLDEEKKEDAERARTMSNDGTDEFALTAIESARQAQPVP